MGLFILFEYYLLISDRINNKHTGKVSTGKNGKKVTKYMFFLLQNLLYSLYKYIYWAKSGIVYIRRDGTAYFVKEQQHRKVSLKYRNLIFHQNLSKNIAIWFLLYSFELPDPNYVHLNNIEATGTSENQVPEKHSLVGEVLA